MSKRWVGFTCPKCHSQMKVTQTGRNEKGSQIIRTRVCIDCGFGLATVEVTSPLLYGITSVERFDPEQKYAKAERRGNKWGAPRRGAQGCGHRTRPDTIDAGVRHVRKGRYLCEHKTRKVPKNFVEV